jgi:hypothetical protein
MSSIGLTKGFDGKEQNTKIGTISGKLLKDRIVSAEILAKQGMSFCEGYLFDRIRLRWVGAN